MLVCPHQTDYIFCLLSWRYLTRDLRMPTKEPFFLLICQVEHILWMLENIFPERNALTKIKNQLHLGQTSEREKITMFNVPCLQLHVYNVVANSFSTSVSLLHPLKTSENRRLSDIFTGYRSGTLVENGLKF